jgi:hypothetical protein
MCFLLTISMAVEMLIEGKLGLAITSIFGLKLITIPMDSEYFV